MTHKRGLYDKPVIGIEIINPEYPPAVNDVLLGYEILRVEPDETCNCFVKPQPSRMNIGGWILFAVTAVLFLPLSALACCIKTSYDTVQRPVYGKPNQD